MEYLIGQTLLLVIVNIILQLFLYKKVRKRDVAYKSVSFIFSVLVLVYIVFGNINLSFFQSFVGWYLEVEPSEGNFYALISLIIVNLIFIYAADKPIFFKKNYQSSFHLKKLDNLIIFFSVLALVVNIINYKNIGGLIIFRAHLTGYERFAIWNKLAVDKGIPLSSFLIFPILIRIFFLKGAKFYHWFFLVSNIVFAAGIGSRQLLIQPFVFFFFFMIFNNKVPLKFILPSIISFGLLIWLFSFYRGDSSNIDFEGGVESFFANEYRDYLRLTTEKISFKKGETLLSIVTNAIPKQLYSALGADKNEYRVYSAYILQEIWGAATGQRAGVWGEFYLNFGYMGVPVLFALLALAIVYFERRFLRRQNSQRNYFLSAYFFNLIVFSIIGSFASIGDDLGSYGVLIWIFSKFCFV